MKIALMGQPNSGKSTIFNHVAVYKAVTSNFPGKTVEYTLTKFNLFGQVIELVDLPGTYSLTSFDLAELEARKAIDDRNRETGDSLDYYGLFEKDNFYRGVYIIRKDHDPNKDKHRILNNYARSQGVKIYNIVPVGFESPIYEKITWQEVESKILPGNPIQTSQP